MKLALVLVMIIGVVVGVSLPASKPHEVAPAAASITASERDDTRRPTVLERGDGGHFWTTVEVNGTPIRFLVDTGASTIALSLSDAKKAGVRFDPTRFEPVAKGAGGIVNGEMVKLNEVVLEGKEATGVTAMVLDGAEVSLLGQNFLRIMHVEINGDTMTLSPA